MLALALNQKTIFYDYFKTFITILTIMNILEIYTSLHDLVQVKNDSLSKNLHWAAIFLELHYLAYVYIF